MKIQTGNFGNNGMQLQRVGTENPEALSTARAEQDAANSTIRAQDTLQQGYRASSNAAERRAQAMGDVGKVVGNIGGAMVEHAQALAKQKAELQLQDYQDFREGQIAGLEQQLRDGQLDSVGFKDAYSKIGEGWKADNIQDLTSADKARLDMGMQRLDRSYGKRAESIYGQAVHVERINAADQTVAGYAQQLMQPNADVAAVNARVDEFFNRAETKALYGAGWAAKYQGAKQSLTTNYYQSMIEKHQDDNGSLNQLREAVISTVTDLKTRTSLLNSIDSKQSRNEAKAQAAQNHADSVRTRQEMQGTRAQDQMTMRIGNGEIPTDQEWAEYERKTANSSAAGSAVDLKKTMVATQQTYKMDPRVAQAQVDQRKLELDRNGGTASDYKVLHAVQAGIDRRMSMVSRDPQRVGAMDAGQPLVPIKPADLQSNPGQVGALLAERADNAKAVAAKYGPTAGKNLLTSEELNDFKTDYANKTQDQRISMWRDIEASAGPDVRRQLAREMGDDTQVTSNVAHLANSPAGWQVARTVEKGNSLLNPTDGAAKVKAPKDEDLQQLIKDHYPDFSAEQVQQSMATARAYHVGLGKDADQTLSSDELEQALGNRVSVFGTTMTAPAGMPGDQFSNLITKQVGRLPLNTAQDVRNNVQRGTYAFLEDSQGNFRLYNKDTNRPVTIDNKPFVVEAH